MGIFIKFAITIVLFAGSFELPAAAGPIPVDGPGIIRDDMGPCQVGNSKDFKKDLAAYKACLKRAKKALSPKPAPVQSVPKPGSADFNGPMPRVPQPGDADFNGPMPRVPQAGDEDFNGPMPNTGEAQATVASQPAANYKLCSQPAFVNDPGCKEDPMALGGYRPNTSLDVTDQQGMQAAERKRQPESAAQRGRAQSTPLEQESAEACNAMFNGEKQELRKAVDMVKNCIYASNQVLVVPIPTKISVKRDNQVGPTIVIEMMPGSLAVQEDEDGQQQYIQSLDNAIREHNGMVLGYPVELIK